VNEKRELNIVFIREFRSFSSIYSKKSKEDYILNVNKIIKDKFDDRFITPNKVQSFIINYEIKKLLDKAINIKNQKYKNIIYLNSNLSVSLIKNAMDFISEEYYPIYFNYSMIEPKEFNSAGLDDISELDVIKQDSQS
jgi:hypothetical protein|tara:strand:- start:188 stop:601 length:414 start_codon:yes stop_codon:yes gene_type:complete